VKAGKGKGREGVLQEREEKRMGVRFVFNYDSVSEKKCFRAARPDTTPKQYRMLLPIISFEYIRT
jgi:hypothetical protein